MKTRHLFYLISTILILISSIFALDYRSKYLDLNSQYATIRSQYETVKEQLDKEVKYQKQLKTYSQGIYESYGKILQNYAVSSKELEVLKNTPKEKQIVVKYRTISAVAPKQDITQTSKLIELIESNKSQIESLTEKLNQVHQQCSQPIVKIVEKEITRSPASVPQKNTPKKVKNNPTDKFH